MIVKHEFHNFPVSEIERLAHRSWIFAYLPKNAIGAEIGVFRGHFAEFILTKLTPKKLYLVDPWAKEGVFWGWNTATDNYGTLPTQYAKEEVLNRIRPFKKTDVVVVVEDYSFNFFRELKHKIEQKQSLHLDFVYIDASHTYEGTYQELCAADAVISQDGFIAGDDWHYHKENKYHGVFRAIHKFLKNYDWQIIAAGEGKQFILRRTPQYPAG